MEVPSTLDPSMGFRTKYPKKDSAFNSSSLLSEDSQAEKPFNASQPTSAHNNVCFGRVQVSEFEHMVPAQWWKAVFADSMYLKTDGDVVEDPLITEEEIKYISF
jgi:hypothetical protein